MDNKYVKLAMLLVLATAGVAAFYLIKTAPPPQDPAAADTDGAGEASPRARLLAAGPRLVSNESDQPITLYGLNLPEGARVLLSAGESSQQLETVKVDDGRLAAVLPEGLPIPPRKPAGDFEVRLLSARGDLLPGKAKLTVINDVHYALPYEMAVSPGGERVYVASPTTDAVFALDTGSGANTRVEVGDRPRHLAIWRSASGREHLLVLHEYEPDGLWILPTSDLSGAPRKVDVGKHPQSVLVDAGSHRAYVSRRVDDDVIAVDLTSGEQVGRWPVGVNPRHMALGGGDLLVGNLGSSDMTLIDLDEAGAEGRRISADGQTEIAGGFTEPYQDYVMGGKAPRDLAWSERLGVFLVSSIGPNIGPNPKRMEVSMNSGVGLVDPATGAMTRHVSMLRGVGERVAVDDARGIVFVADLGMGRVVAMDLARMVGPREEARRSVLAAVEVPPPDGIPKLRDGEDLGVERRATESLHSGTRVVALADGGRRLFALNRFTGVVVEVDTSEAAGGSMAITSSWPVVPVEHQKRRRLGEVAYYTDMGNSRMSCDACHYEGHSEGVLFTKNRPMHIYRTPSLRGIRETPPYFTPALFPTLETVMEVVMARNRYHNPDPSRREIGAGALYQATLAPVVNPWLGTDGAPPQTVALPDGREGDPREGAAIFDGVGECVTCHPPPQFTTDQDKATRGQLHNVGTGVTIMLRAGMQDAAPYKLPPPSLVGVWDHFPLLHSGRAGFDAGDKGQVVPGDPFALGEVFEIDKGAKRHGKMAELTEQQRDDLIAYLMTL